MTKIITGEMDGEVISRDETVFDRLEPLIGDSPRQNNSRKIINSALEGFKMSRSESNQAKVEELTGLVGDHLDSDWGNYPEPLINNE